jgi:hypothetical protein
VVSEAAATTSVLQDDTTTTSTLAAVDVSVQHGRAESIRSISTVDSDVSDASDVTTASDKTLKEKESSESHADEEGLPQPPVSAALDPSATKGSAFSTLSGFLNRGLRLNHLEVPPSETSTPEDNTGPHVKLTFRHENKKMSCIVYYAEQFAGEHAYI